MARVPSNPTGIGQGLLARSPRPSDANILMSAADMAAQGQLGPTPKLRSPQGSERPKLPARKVRKLKVVK